MSELDARLAAIDQARQRLDVLRPLPVATLRSLHEDPQPPAGAEEHRR